MTSMLDGTVLTQAAETLDRLRQAGLQVVTAESCTGGLVAAALTHHAGSSDMVQGGFITYSNDMKTALLGVAPALLARHGAVSAEVAAAMAEGALSRAPHAAIAVSITGIAGPGGGSASKPVGLVWFGTARRGGQTRTLSRHFGGDRTAVRQRAVVQALDLIRQRIGTE
ncbi:nicotinamide-nucleotide amidohydrolase family protein [Gluconacetobacter diazotrophicus]|uniref:Nicotinamide-nucleotide amidohydrolase family protein n=2 Tax=Gluconacetobacter diazotrophicus TaxID=33996 RepID=A0A7W4I6R1_GLUDI|nr:nicotinamide-nucleotide amidohydrolase family protein [Gluconacetobacter diazotrophicus]MBB2157299.1 nicotinamide-nucleotide amidohydrolase family protein [Gluconacetobacter diazotrophicus]